MRGLNKMKQILVVGNLERPSAITEVLLASLNELHEDVGLCILECPEPIIPPDIEMILGAHPIELLEASPMFNEKPLRRGGQKHNKWKNTKKLK